MSYSKLEAVLKTVLPDVYKLEAPEQDANGNYINRFIVWTPEGTRLVYANGKPFATIYLAQVTIGTQIENDDLPELVRAALAKAHIPMSESRNEFSPDPLTVYTDIDVEVM